MREFRFKQLVDGELRYWGFFNQGTNFVGPFTEKDGTTPESHQFTGLLDNQGKEIYEGDVVKEIGIPDAEEDPIGVVKISSSIGPYVIFPAGKYKVYRDDYNGGSYCVNISRRSLRCTRKRIEVIDANKLKESK